MQTLTYTNSLGESLTLSGSFLVSKVTGLGDVDADIQTQKSPFQDGSSYLDSLLVERMINFEVGILGSGHDDISSKRQQLSRVFNPKLGKGVLRYQYGTIVREIEAVPDSVPVFPSGNENRGISHQIAVITLLCPNPYWKSLDITEEPAFEPLFSFPFEGKFQMGIQRDQRIIVNDGDSPSPVYIEFYGPATNPIITNNTTGEYIKVNQTLGENEYMRIDTTRGKKSVEFVAEDGTVTNVFNWIDLGSTLFQLVIGENDIQYSADSDIQGAIVNIRYNKLYNAI
jgi:Phage tail protein